MQQGVVRMLRNANDVKDMKQCREKRNNDDVDPKEKEIVMQGNYFSCKE
jgi:hypothetical protein